MFLGLSSWVREGGSRRRPKMNKDRIFQVLRYIFILSQLWVSVQVSLKAFSSWNASPSVTSGSENISMKHKISFKNWTTSLRRMARQRRLKVASNAAKLSSCHMGCATKQLQVPKLDVPKFIEIKNRYRFGHL